MFCMNCGKELEPGSVFCLYCGAKQEQEPEARPIDEAPPQAQAFAMRAAAEKAEEKDARITDGTSSVKPETVEKAPPVSPPSAVSQVERADESPVFRDMSQAENRVEAEAPPTEPPFTPPEAHIGTARSSTWQTPAPESVILSAPASPRKTSTGKIAAIVAAVFVLLAGCAFGGWRVVQQRHEQELQAAQEQAAQAQLEAEQAQQAVEAAQAEQEKAKADAEQAQKDAEAAKQEADKAKADAATQAASNSEFQRPRYESNQWKTATAQLFSEYMYGLTEAINYQDFSLVSSCFVHNSQIYKDQKTLVDSLGRQDITEEVITYEITSQTLDDDKAALISDETIGVTYGDGSYKEVRQSYKYLMSIQSNGNWLMYDMIEQ